jgi:hypothetical protein
VPSDSDLAADQNVTSALTEHPDDVAAPRE